MLLRVLSAAPMQRHHQGRPHRAALNAPASPQGDYSIRRIGAGAQEEGQRLAGEATPQPSGLIAAFLGSAARAPGSAAGAGGAGEGLSAAKTPVLHVNPLADYL